MLAQLPPDAAKVLFGREVAPAAGPAQAIGAYERGCLSGAVALPADGPNWEVMRPSRHRAWGHPVLIALLERLAAKLPAEAGWPGLLVGDIAQPRGGPMLTGHGSHQIGLDADLWLTPMPDRRLSPSERDELSATDVVTADGMGVDAAWTPQHKRLLETVAREPVVARIFVNPAIKRALCREAGSERTWLTKFGRGGATITIFMFGFPARAASRNAITRHRLRRAMAAAKNSIGGLPKKRFTRRHPHPPDPCGWRICRALVRRWSQHQVVRPCMFRPGRGKAQRRTPDRLTG